MNMAINSMSNIVSINAQNFQQVLGETSQQKVGTAKLLLSAKS